MTTGAAPRDPPHVEEFLGTAIAAAGSLAELHATGAVHGSLTPEWVGTDHAAGPPQVWAYRSPEQTGRLQRPVDARSDLYTLGVLLYELLTGALPFEAGDALEWAHRHLAVPPRRPRSIDPSIPEAIERVLLRLLEKDPDDRYQTAAGLRHDLARCHDEWQQTGGISSFALGQHDRGDVLSIPQKVYGRGRERSALLDALATLRTDGGPRLALVTGPPGVGKTALLRELAAPVAAAGGFLLSGKFEDGAHAVPYAPIAHAFGDAVATILAGREEALAAWRAELQIAVGNNGRVLTDLLPQLDLVLGPQPEVPSLPPDQTHFRFVGTFCRFAGVFATSQPPLVLVLDDLQWGDDATLRLVAALVSDRSLRSLLVVGSYRDEPPARASLSRMLDDARDVALPIETIELGPLAPEPLTELLADALDMDATECTELQAALFQKTGGNPLFFTQLLLDLRRRGLVHFDRDTLVWQWDAHDIEQVPVSDNVVDLLTRRLAGCPADMRRALALAACLGGSFEPRLLARVAQAGIEETAHIVEAAVRAGFLVRGPDAYRFSHDRVREAAYNTIPVVDRAVAHLASGRALRAVDADLFEIVGQLNQGRSEIDDDAERLDLARLDKVAANRARAAGAFDAVGEYSRTGLELLGADLWSREHDLTFTLTRDQAEAQLFAGDVGRAEQLLASALEHASTPLERLSCARLWVDMKATTGALVEGMQLVIEVLQDYGLDVTLYPDDVEDLERAIWARLGEEPEAVLSALPRGEDAEAAALLELLARAGPHGYLIHPNLHRLLACSVIDITLQRGVFAASTWGLAAYGLELSSDGRYAAGAELSQVALRLLDRHGFVTYRPFVCILLGWLAWTRDLGTATAFAREGIRSSLENGDMVSALMSWQVRCVGLLTAGAPIPDIEREAREGIELARRVRFGAMADALVLIRQYARALRGDTDGLDRLTGPGFDAAALDGALGAETTFPMRAWFALHMLQMQVFAGAFTDALRSDDDVRSRAGAFRGLHAQVDVVFFGALAIAGCDADVRRARLPALRDAAAQLDTWAAGCPSNFAHHAALVAGEIARAEGRSGAALELFAVAIARAQLQHYLHVEALAYESAARLCCEQGLAGPEAEHLRAAIGCYRRWGATAKAAQLEARLPSVTGGRDERRGVLDALAVAKAAQAISGEVVHARVLERLLETVIEHAGARGGAVLLSRAGETVVAATADRTQTAVRVTVHDPPLAPGPDLVPETLVNYVTRTKQPLVLGDVTNQPAFAADPYIARRNLRSVLCVPILAQRELRGLLCLENDLIADAFTTGQLDALEVLTAQAVVSLENASLYGELRREIAERERYEGKLQYLADHDSLTGLLNRRRFREEFDRELARARRSAVPGAVLAIDVDNLKYVNDSLGHSRGDELITNVAALFARRVRGTDVLARIGGDEFAVILPGVSEHEARLVAHALLQSLSTELEVDFTGGTRPVTASIGIATFASASDITAEELLMQADIAMYDAKESGRNRAAVYSARDERQERMQARLTWGERIRRALRDNRLVLHAQPIAPLRPDPYARHELLVRMLDDSGDLISPGTFLPIAERMDLVDRIDRWVVTEAVRLLASEQRSGHDPRLYVNLSAVSLADETLPDFIADELAAAGAHGRGLCFEITETTAIINMDLAATFAARVAERGCQFALDDFGTGFASFYYLKHLPFDYLKIDGEFIKDLASNPRDQLVVKSIAEIAHGLGKATIAEFVSDNRTVELLQSYGVDYAQGFFIAKPAPITEIDLTRQPKLSR